jgi:hypothetical protein
MSATRAWLPLVVALLLFAGLAVAMPPLVIRAFVAAQRRLGNGGHSRVQAVERNAAPLTRTMWVFWAIGAVMGLPFLVREAARDIAAGGGAASSPVGRAAVAADDAESVTVPGPGTPPRDAILDAVRERLDVTSRFRVDHVAMAATDAAYAFVRATEVVDVNGPDAEEQETELTVMALLELPQGGAGRAWRVVELWTLPGDAERPRRDFVRRVRARQAAARLPAALFPAGL